MLTMLTEREMKAIRQQQEAEHYQEWFMNKWAETGGLITKSNAARILGRSRCLITLMIQRGKLREHKYKPTDEGFVEMSQIIIYKRLYKYRYAKFVMELIRKKQGIEEKTSLEKFLEGYTKETIEKDLLAAEREAKVS